MEQNIDTDQEIVPGTVHLVDLQGILNVQKDANSKHNIILVPQPSSNPNDPLRWSQKKKIHNLHFFGFGPFCKQVRKKLLLTYLFPFYIFMYILTRQ